MVCSASSRRGPSPQPLRNPHEKGGADRPRLFPIPSPPSAGERARVRGCFDNVERSFPSADPSPQPSPRRTGARVTVGWKAAEGESDLAVVQGRATGGLKLIFTVLLVAISATVATPIARAADNQ